MVKWLLGLCFPSLPLEETPDDVGTWRHCVEEDLAALGVDKEVAHERRLEIGKPTSNLIMKTETDINWMMMMAHFTAPSTWHPPP